MVGLKIGGIGNREFKDLCFVEDVIHTISIYMKDAIIYSGGAEGTDETVELTAKRDGLAYVPKDPKNKSHDELFARSDELASDVEMIIAFNNKRWYYTGTFHTINTFTKLGKYAFLIFNEERGIWWYKDLPKWLKDRILKNHKEYPSLSKFSFILENIDWRRR